MILALLGFAALSSGGAAADGGSGPEDYVVAMKLSEDGRPFATPRLTMREGGTATMSVGGPGGYSIRVRLNRARESTVPPQRLSVASEIHLHRGGRWVLVGTPTVMVPLGREAQMEIAPSSASDGFKGIFAMTVLVSPGRPTEAR